MGPGTGLGQANLYWSENFGGYRVWPSEGAHASFAPRGWKQRALQTHVERQLGYCEVEHVSQPACMQLHEVYLKGFCECRKGHCTCTNRVYVTI